MTLPIPSLLKQVYLSIALLAHPSPDLKCTADAIYWEARSEPATGQQAVAWVIRNRVAAPKFPKSACAVAHAPKSFSYYWDHKPEVVKDKRAYRQALITAAFVEAGLTPDPTAGAIFYHEKRVNPYWRKGEGLPIGGHLFYAGAK